VIVLSI